MKLKLMMFIKIYFKIKECTLNKTTKLRGGSVLDDSIFKKIDRRKK